MKTLQPYILAALCTALSATAVSCTCGPLDPLQGGIKTYSGAKGEPQGQQPPAYVQPTPVSPAIANPVERHITVTASNSIFSIGIPAGYTEERIVTAQKPLNFWFEYLTADEELTVNGFRVEIPGRRSSAKLAYTTNTFGFNYVIKNLSQQAVSYNLHLEPSTPGESVPATTWEKWTAP